MHQSLSLSLSLRLGLRGLSAPLRNARSFALRTHRRADDDDGDRAKGNEAVGVLARSVATTTPFKNPRVVRDGDSRRIIVRRAAPEI